MEGMCDSCLGSLLWLAQPEARACGGRAMLPTPPVRPLALAIYSERGFRDIPLGRQGSDPGGNVRLFNTVDAQRGSDIALVGDTGRVRVVPGSYDVSVQSVVMLKDSTCALDASEVRSLGYNGYCIIFAEGAKHGVRMLSSTAGTVNAGAYPSLIEGHLVFDEPTEFWVLQQNGQAAVDVFYTQVRVEPPENHVFARIRVERREQ